MHTVNGGKEEKKRNKFDWLRKEDNIEIAITMPEEQWAAHGGVQACDLCYSRKVCESLLLSSRLQIFYIAQEEHRDAIAFAFRRLTMRKYGRYRGRQRWRYCG